MSQVISLDNTETMPRSLRPASLWKRAAIGLLTLIIGVIVAAWLLHASIDERQAANTQVSGTPANVAAIRN